METMKISSEIRKPSKTREHEAASSKARGSEIRPSLQAANEKLKAENEKLKSEMEKMKMIKSEIRELSKTTRQKAASSKARAKEIEKIIVKAHALDLCFLLDATGSMTKSMDMVKEKVGAMAAAIKAAYCECKMRVALVVYRDYDMPITEENMGCHFTNDFEGAESLFIRELSSVRAIGGGDVVEDVFSGLEWVAKLDWKAMNRVLVHICDTPCHGTRFHNLAPTPDNDKYPEGDKLNRDVAKVLEQLREKCPVYQFCHLNQTTKKMVQEFSNATGNGDWIREVYFEDITLIPRVVVESSCRTISKTLSTLSCRRGGRTDNYIPEVIEASEPTNWKDITISNGVQYQHKQYALDDLLTNIRKQKPLDLSENYHLRVQIAPKPFSAEGAVRWPFHARLLEKEHTAKEDTVSHVVVKRFKIRVNESVIAAHSQERYQSQMEVQTVATDMATAFNRRIESGGLRGVKKVEFTRASVLKVGLKFYNMEKYLDGTWIKYSNNGGYVNTDNYAATLHAFTHWTFEHSMGLLMVTDLQGVVIVDSKNESTFLLCDPAIHCADLNRFTNTNFGEYGFKLFFNNHTCNNICRHLDLKSKGGYVDVGTLVESMERHHLIGPSETCRPPGVTCPCLNMKFTFRKNKPVPQVYSKDLEVKRILTAIKE